MSRKGARPVIAGVMAMLVAVLVVLKVLNIFPSPEKAEGTIGGVEKVERFRGQQMNFKDIKTDDPEVAQVIQSAEFQNLLKDENFRSILANPQQVEYVPLAVEVNQIVSQAAQDFYDFLQKGDNAIKFFDSKEYHEFYASLEPEDTAGLLVILNPAVSNGIVPTAQDLQKSYMLNAEFQKLALSFPFQAVYNQDIQSIFGQDFVKLCAGDFQSLMPHLQSHWANDFLNVLHSSALNTIICSQEFQKLCESQEFQKIWSQDFQKVFMSQEFQNYVLSQEFQNALKNIETKFY
ncbi:MAG TPA: hypothetical protein ENN20_04815 [Candidatus Marinimicrobia bacterium]|nr:hypothetical protein [Candidatus Neomarinimicrobiota bacterium]